MKKLMKVLFITLFLGIIYPLTAEASASNSASDASIQLQATSHTQAEALQWVKSQVGNRIGGGECVELITAYYSYLGVSPVSGNGSDYTWNALPAGWQRLQGATPQPGDILVYTGGYKNYGHVAIFESAYSTYHQNYDYNRTVQHVTQYAYNGFTTPYWGVIRPDFSSKWYSSMTPVNIGTDVYAYLLKMDGWKHLGASGDNVELTEHDINGSDLWHFVRQSDGSYIIYNMREKDKVLDVTGGLSASGTNVGIYKKWGDNNTAQKWYIYGRWSGEYIFRPQCSDAVLDVTGGYSTIGTNVQLWTYNNGNAQQMAIYPAERAEATTLHVVPDTNIGDTLFSWAEAKGATRYNLRIKKGTPGNVTTYKDVWNITDTSVNVKLPAGYYEAYVDSANVFSYQKSNDVKFYVAEFPFSDVSADDWYYKTVVAINSSKLMTGMDSTHFAPTSPLARAQFATIIYRMNGEPAIKYSPIFPDVRNGQWYTNAILWAAGTKVVTGYTNTGMFGPTDYITREQMAVMMYRYAKYNNCNVNYYKDLGAFKDHASVSAYAYDAMKWAVGTEIITGKDNGTILDPLGTASRAECAAIINRFTQRYSHLNIQQ